LLNNSDGWLVAAKIPASKPLFEPFCACRSLSNHQTFVVNVQQTR